MMTDFTITIKESVSVVPWNPTNKWNSITWGTDEWGAVPEMVTDTGKLISETVTPADSILEKQAGKLVSEAMAMTFGYAEKKVEHLLDLGSTTLSDNYDQAVAHAVDLGSVVNVSDVITLELTDDGYNYVFPGDTTDAVDRVSATWSETASVSVSYSTPTPPSTVWTDA